MCKPGWVATCPWCVLALVLLCLRSTHYPGTMQRIWIFATTYWLALLNTESHLGHKREVQCHQKRNRSRVLRVGCAPLKSHLYLPVSREKAVFLFVSFESRKKIRNIWLASCQAYTSSICYSLTLRTESRHTQRCRWSSTLCWVEEGSHRRPVLYLSRAQRSPKTESWLLGEAGSECRGELTLYMGGNSLWLHCGNGHMVMWLKTLECIL